MEFKEMLMIADVKEYVSKLNLCDQMSETQLMNVIVTALRLASAEDMETAIKYLALMIYRNSSNKLSPNMIANHIFRNCVFRCVD